MWFQFLAILTVLATKTIADPTALSVTGSINKPKALDPKMTCDQLPQNSCLYSFYAAPNSATTTIVDQGCNDYGQDHFVFNSTKIWFLDLGPQPVKNHVWVISNFTRLNAPNATVSFMGRYNSPQLQWLDKEYTVPILPNLSLGSAVLSTLGFGKKSIVVYRAQIPC
ncbi:hypothetical protein DSL72_006987 [Monilinia vaccinii-corymbosi]|uniref:Uncharacterized protein n=1 Tax=Monilinia vaccinii-corymbosi TaxID=61207 RepID=A0A8A3PLK5_9HELO|nr:hypothetical protein DSL72_006987 [Monilinia vaccinii-corymbosi]